MGDVNQRTVTRAGAHDAVPEGDRRVDRRELLRKGAAIGVGGTLASSLLAACGGGGASGTSGPLTVWTQQAEATGYPAVFEDGGRRVVANGKATAYKYTTVDPSNYNTKFKTACIGGLPPDVGYMATDGNYPAFVEANLLEPLDSVNVELPNVPPSVMDTLKIDGTRYAIPLDLNNLTIGYNKSIFAKLGLSVPSTFEELLALNKPLRDAGYQPLALPAKDRWACSDIFLACLAYTDTSGGDALPQAERSELPWTAEPFVQAAEMAAELQKSGLLVDGVSSLDVLGTITLFGNEKAAMMYPVGNFFAGLIDQANQTDFEYGIFPVPPPTAGIKARATGGAAILWAVPAKAKNKEGAFDFLKEMNKPETAKLLLAKGFIPAGAYDDPPELSGVLAEMLKLQPDVARRGLYVPAVSTALENSMTALLSGDGSAADVIKQIQSAAA